MASHGDELPAEHNERHQHRPKSRAVSRLSAGGNAQLTFGDGEKWH
jgi:hypothetical protein